MRREFKNIFIFILTICLGIWGIACSSKPYYKETRFLMGTVVEIISQDMRANDLAFSEIKRIEKLLNKFDPHSEVSILNAYGLVKASPDTLRVIKISKEFNKLSDGGFDITVAPLVDLWKEAIKTKILPKETQIIQARQMLGSQNILIDEKKSAIKFLKKGMQIDLGAIAKGYAVDSAINKLKEQGVESALVNAGGNIYCLGKKYNRPWRIGLQHPRQMNKMTGYLDLSDQAVATSGDYQQYFIYQGKRYSHIIDPKTGYPVDNGVVCVTVIAGDATTADALSTSIFVLGKERSEVLAKIFPGVEVRIITKDELQNNR